jgi:uncharacterized protein (TIGR03118 family)
MNKTRSSALFILLTSPALALIVDGCGDDTTTTPTDGGAKDATTTTADGTVNDSSTSNEASSSDGGSSEGGGDASTMGPPLHVTETKLFANSPEGGAANVDPNLLNAWGLVFNATGVAWVSDNHSGLLTAYPPNALAPAVVVTVPGPNDAGDAAAGGGTPTGQVFNILPAEFMGDKFIASTEDGTIAAWQSGTVATIRVDNSGTNAIYKGLAIVPSTPTTLVAADFHNGKLVVFDDTYVATTLASGKWIDPSIPAGYAPYNVAALGTNVFVTYAKQDANKADDVPGDGFGALSVFDTSGTLVKSLVAVGGALDAPWGMALVPSGGFGTLPAGALVVGSFGDGTIQAYDTTTGAHLATFTSANNPLLLEGLWGLAFGKDLDAGGGDAGQSSKQLYFTAGPNGEKDGLFGYLIAQ